MCPENALAKLPGNAVDAGDLLTCQPVPFAETTRAIGQRNPNQRALARSRAGSPTIRPGDATTRRFSR